MNENEIRTTNLIKTPIHGIPIGEPFINDSGQIILRIKKKHTSEYEDLTFEQLTLMIVAGAEKSTTNQ